MNNATSNVLQIIGKFLDDNEFESEKTPNKNDKLLKDNVELKKAEDQNKKLLKDIADLEKIKGQNKQLLKDISDLNKVKDQNKQLLKDKMELKMAEDHNKQLLKDIADMNKVKDQNEKLLKDKMELKMAEDHNKQLLKDIADMNKVKDQNEKLLKDKMELKMAVDQNKKLLKDISDLNKVKDQNKKLLKDIADLRKVEAQNEKLLKEKAALKKAEDQKKNQNQINWNWDSSVDTDQSNKGGKSKIMLTETESPVFKGKKFRKKRDIFRFRRTISLGKKENQTISPLSAGLIHKRMKRSDDSGDGLEFDAYKVKELYPLKDMISKLEKYPLSEPQTVVKDSKTSHVNSFGDKLLSTRLRGNKYNKHVTEKNKMDDNQIGEDKQQWLDEDTDYQNVNQIEQDNFLVDDSTLRKKSKGNNCLRLTYATFVSGA